MVTLERAIVGALTDTINAHGPITRQWIGSAAKRVAGNLPALRAAPPSEREAKLTEALRAALGALSRTEQALQLAVRGSPLRDMAETLAEAAYAHQQGRAALGEAPDADHD